MRTLTLALTVITLVAARPAHADCTEDGSGCPGLGVAIAGISMALGAEASVGVGGVVTMIDGAVDSGRHRVNKTARVMNYVFGTLNLAAGTIWLAIEGDGALGLAVGIPHLAVGAGDLVAAAVDQRRSHPESMPIIVPVVGGDRGHVGYGGAMLAFRF